MAKSFYLLVTCDYVLMSVCTTDTQNMQYLLLSHGKNCYANAPHC